jgi:hypothetical protein
MADYWLTLQIDAQRTRDLRVCDVSFAEVARKYKKKDGYRVIAIRPCEKEANQTTELNQNESLQD